MCPSLTLVASDVNKDLTFKANDKDQTFKDKDQDKDCILVLKESLRTRTRTNITAAFCVNVCSRNAVIASFDDW